MKNKFENVMLIDDNDLDNFIHEKVIERSKFAKTILVHSSALSALDFFKSLIDTQDCNTELYPEIIFVDINMPIKDGFQFIEELYKIFDELLVKPKLFMLSSSLFQGDRLRASSLSPDIGFISKPLSLEKLELIK